MLEASREAGLNQSDFRVITLPFSDFADGMRPEWKYVVADLTMRGLTGSEPEIPALPLPTCVRLGKLQNHAEFCFCLYDGDDNSTPPQVVGGLNIGNSA